MKDFRQLKVWEKSACGITSQMRRSSASIAANLAEGCGRTGDGDFHRFLNNAAGSAVELEYFLLLAHDLNLLSTVSYEPLHGRIMEVQRMLASLLRTVDRNRKKKQLASR